MNPDQIIELSLTAADCNALMIGLVEVPYKVAAPLIDKIRTQILAIDSTAFDMPQANGAIATPVPPPTIAPMQ